MPMYTKTGRSLWPLVIGGALVLVVAVVAVLVSLTRDDAATADPSPSPVTTAPPVTSSPTPSPIGTHEGQAGGTPELGDPPTGCLAGPGTDAKMVLATQAAAPHTAYGAVEVAASLMRWTNQYPFPSRAQISAIEKSVLSPDMAPAMRDLAAGFDFIAKDPKMREDTPPGPAKFGTPYTVSTRPGRWLVDPASTDDRVTVHLSLGVVVNGVVSTETYGMGSPVLVWQNNAWRVVDTVPTNTSALKAGGTSFTGGC